jgi:hypothetical protein
MLGSQILYAILAFTSVSCLFASLVLEIIEWAKSKMERSLAVMLLAALPCGFTFMTVVISVFNIYFIMNWEQDDYWKYESTYMGPSTWLQFLVIIMSLLHLFSLVGFQHFLMPFLAEDLSDTIKNAIIKHNKTMPVHLTKAEDHDDSTK